MAEKKSSRERETAVKKSRADVSGTCHWKVLVPSSVLGSIIGRDGCVIKQLEACFRARIMISESSDLYPGTSDRVCLVSGYPDGVMKVNKFIMERVSMMENKPSQTCYDYVHKVAYERSKQVKILFPQSSMGKIIGYQGANIENMKAVSGSFIQISQTPTNVHLLERCVIVAGEMQNNMKACSMIFDAFAEDTRAFYQNVSYSRVNFPIPNAFPAGSALAPMNKISSRFSRPYARNSRDCNFLDDVEKALRRRSFDDSVISTACKSFGFLIDHGIMNACSTFLVNFLGSHAPLKSDATVKTNTSAVSAQVPAASVYDVDKQKMNVSSLFSENYHFYPPEDTKPSVFPDVGSQGMVGPNYMSYWNTTPSSSWVTHYPSARITRPDLPPDDDNYFGAINMDCRSKDAPDVVPNFM